MQFIYHHQKKLALLFCLLLLCGLATQKAIAGTPEQLQVIASIAPQKYFIEKIAGKYAQVLVLVKPGSDPHSYEPRASQMAAAAKARLYFTAGIGLEAAWAGRIRDVSPGLALIHLTAEGIECSTCSEEQAGHDAVSSSETPKDTSNAQAEHASTGSLHMDAGHTWLSPAHVRLMIPVIVKALSDEMPMHAAEFNANAENFVAELDELDRAIKELFNDIPEGRRVFITFHPAWKNFADDYGLTGISIEHNGKSPGPQRLALLSKQAEQKNIRTIFIEPQHSAQIAGAVAESIGARLLTIDPLAENWADNLLRCAGLFASAMRESL